MKKLIILIPSLLIGYVTFMIIVCTIVDMYIYGESEIAKWLWG